MMAEIEDKVKTVLGMKNDGGNGNGNGEGGDAAADDA
jgi:hypothetical protein